jgi:2-dehydro-3-deoxyphosphooctonate aldolase (KDO 8-P synthase)
MFFILGPCVIESADHAVRMASRISRICAGLHAPFIFKASFDKANRLSMDSFRGPGLETGMRILSDIKAEVGCRVTSDIHEVWQAELAGKVLDVIQIPALLCRQTDLVVAAAKTGRTVNIKKGQFMAPEDMAHIVNKARRAGAEEIWVTERGTSFGYRDLILDMRSIPVMQKATMRPVIVDVSHAVQSPGGANGKSTGRADLIPTLARAATAAGADGVFIEVHDNPAEARSDSGNSLPLGELQGLLQSILRIKGSI